MLVSCTNQYKRRCLETRHRLLVQPKQRVRKKGDVTCIPVPIHFRDKTMNAAVCSTILGDAKKKVIETNASGSVASHPEEVSARCGQANRRSCCTAPWQLCRDSCHRYSSIRSSFSLAAHRLYPGFV